MKYYAIRHINGEPVKKIVTTWDECKALVYKQRVEYKSFTDKEEALAYLGSYVEEESENDVIANPDNIIYYVDGSYKDDMIGWGVVLIKDKKVITKMCGGITPTEFTSRNITGELESAKMAVRHAIANGFKEIYIVNDYQGISSYVTGAWEADKQESKDYLAWMNKALERVKVNFIKVAGHSNNEFNDMVDELAKEGVTL